MARPVFCPQRCGVFARRVGIYQQKLSGYPCLIRLAAVQLWAWFSSLRAAGITTATERMLSASRRCLLATGTTRGTAIGASLKRATTHPSGVLLRMSTLVAVCALCTCTMTTTMRAWTSARRTTGSQFVVSRISWLAFCPCKAILPKISDVFSLPDHLRLWANLLFLTTRKETLRLFTKTILRSLK